MYTLTGKKEVRSYFSVEDKPRNRIAMIIIVINVRISITLGLLFFMSGPDLPMIPSGTWVHVL